MFWIFRTLKFLFHGTKFTIVKFKFFRVESCPFVPLIDEIRWADFEKYKLEYREPSYVAFLVFVASELFDEQNSQSFCCKLSAKRKQSIESILKI